MKQLKSTLLAAIISAAVLSCGGNDNHEHMHEHSTESTDATHQHHDESTTHGIELNNGAKWAVNEEMKPFVNKGEALVASFSQHNGTEFTKLAKEVGIQNEQLIKSCTMKGKSHDELHKWLAPHLALVKELENVADSVKAKHIVAQLEKSYQDYSNFFQ